MDDANRANLPHASVSEWQYPVDMSLHRLLAAAAVCILPVFGEVTFNKDVAPVLYKHCATCHRPNDIAPMVLLTYKQARPWASAIREAVLTKRMPPWHADPKYGDFANDARLNEDEIRTLKEWAETGAKEGDPTDLPPAPKFSDEWRLGKPDLIFSIPEERIVKAGERDYNIGIAVPTNLKEDIWVQGVELRPGNRKVVHHAHVFIEMPDAPKSKTTAPAQENPFPELDRKKIFFNDGQTHVKLDAPVINDGCSHPAGGDFPNTSHSGESGILASYLPGREPDHWPAGFGRRVPAGAILKFQIHYSSTTGKDETDRTSVGLILSKEPPQQLVQRLDVHNHFFKIPAGAPNQEVTACYSFDRDVELLTYTPHMHYRGKDMKFETEHPDGTFETLLWVPKYDFEWQTTYRLTHPLNIPKGTRLRITAHFDNSANNPKNPDPARVIRWGEPSNEEMMDGWFEYLVPNNKNLTRASAGQK